MSDKKHHIDQLFQSGLKGHKVPAPKNAWARLQHDLQKPPRTAFFYFSRIAAAVVLLMLAFGAGYFLSETNRKDNPPVIVQNQNTTAKPVDKTSLIDDLPESEKILNTESAGEKVSHQQDAENPKETFAANPTKPANAATSNPEDLHPAEALTAIDNNTASQPVLEIPASETQIAGNHLADDGTEITPKTTEASEGNTEIIDEIPAPNMMTPEMLQRLLAGNNDDLLFANAESPTETKISRWSLGGRVSPVYSYRSLDGEYFAQPDETVDASFFDQHEDGITTIAGGISLDYQLNQRFSLGSGMFISRIGQQNNNVLAYNDPEFSNMYKLASSTGSVSVNPAKFDNAIQKPVAITKDSVPGDYLINGSFVQNLDYLEIPLILKYKVIESKISLQLMGGLSPGVLVNNRSYFQLDGEKLQTGTTENINPFIYNSIVGFGLSYSLSEKLSLNMEPSFKYALSPVNSSTGINYRPYSFTWFTGISYRIY